MLVMLLWYSINAQSFLLDKSSSTSQVIKVKSRNLKKLLRYLKGKVTSTLNDVTHGCVCPCASPGLVGCDGLSDIFHQFHLYNNSTNLFNNCDYILTDYTLA